MVDINSSEQQKYIDPFSFFSGKFNSTKKEWYFAPEHIFTNQKHPLRQSSLPADIWSLGCVFAELLLGEQIFC